jgi:hypothetical protein
MTGVVEAVNELRAVFFVRCADGLFAYFRVAREELPNAGDVLSWAEPVSSHGGRAINETGGVREMRISGGVREMRILSAIQHLPREVARSLIG